MKHFVAKCDHNYIFKRGVWDLKYYKTIGGSKQLLSKLNSMTTVHWIELNSMNSKDKRLKALK